MKLLLPLPLLSSFSCLVGVASQCSEDEHHPENGGYYLVGAAGMSDLTDLDSAHGQMLPNNTWAPGIYYPHGETDEEGNEMAFTTHTCSILSFCPSNDATEAVYELPHNEAIRDCDFSSAKVLGEMNGAASADDGCFRYSFEEDHELKEYFFASKEGCDQGQRLKVKVQDFSMTADQCIKIGLTTPRIRNCDCRLKKQASTLGEPCRTAFSDSCQESVIETDECCDAGTCMSIYEDYNHPEGKKKEDERQEQCKDDMPGLCYNVDGKGTDTNRMGSTDCCTMTCSECGILTKFTAQWKPCEALNSEDSTAACGFLSRYDQEPFKCDFSKCAAGDHWHTEGAAFRNAFGIADEDVTPTTDEDVTPTTEEDVTLNSAEDSAAAADAVALYASLLSLLAVIMV